MILWLLQRVLHHHLMASYLQIHRSADQTIGCMSQTQTGRVTMFHENLRTERNPVKDNLLDENYHNHNYCL